jgi:hypothetical protein
MAPRQVGALSQWPGTPDSVARRWRGVVHSLPRQPWPHRASRVHFLEPTCSFHDRLRTRSNTVNQRQRVSTLVAAAMMLGCHHRVGRNDTSAASTSNATSRDSLIGVVALVGTSLENRLVLRTTNQETVLWPNAADSAALVRAAGTNVRDEVRRRPPDFQSSSSPCPVSRLTWLRTASCSATEARSCCSRETESGGLGNPPKTFDALIGARLWVGGPLDTGPNDYGILVPPR